MCDWFVSLHLHSNRICNDRQRVLMWILFSQRKRASHHLKEAGLMKNVEKPTPPLVVNFFPFFLLNFHWWFFKNIMVYKDEDTKEKTKQDSKAKAKGSSGKYYFINFFSCCNHLINCQLTINYQWIQKISVWNLISQRKRRITLSTYFISEFLMRTKRLFFIQDHGLFH